MPPPCAIKSATQRTRPHTGADLCFDKKKNIILHLSLALVFSTVAFRRERLIEIILLVNDKQDPIVYAFGRLGAEYPVACRHPVGMLLGTTRPPGAARGVGEGSPESVERPTPFPAPLLPPSSPASETVPGVRTHARTHSRVHICKEVHTYSDAPMHTLIRMRASRQSHKHARMHALT